MSLMIFTRTVVFALAVSCLSISVNAQTSPIPNKWNQVTACGFSFLLPDTLQRGKRKGKDTCVAIFEDNEFHVYLDYGRYQTVPTPRQAWMKSYENVPIMIDRRKGNLITYNGPDDSGDYPYRTDIYIGTVKGEKSLKIMISTKTSADPQLVKKIYESVKFLGS